MLRDKVIVLLSTILSVGIAFFTQGMLTRGLSVADFGRYSSILSTVNLVLPIASLGSSTYWLKLYGKNGFIAGEAISKSMRFGIISSLTTILLISSSSFLANDDFLMISIFLSTSIVVLVAINYVSVLSQVTQRWIIMAIATLILPVFRLAGLSIVSELDIFSLWSVSFTWVVLNVIVLLILIALIFYLLREEKSLVNWEVNTSRFFRSNMPYLFLGVMYLAWSHGHIILSGILLDIADAGRYATVMNISIAVSILPNVLFSNYYAPQFHTLTYSSRGKLKRMVFKYGFYLFCLGCVASLFIYLFSYEILEIIYGDAYKKLGRNLFLISLIFPIRWFGFPLGATMNTGDFANIKWIALLVAVILNICLVILLVNRYNLEGMIFSIIITESVLVLFYTVYLKIKL